MLLGIITIALCGLVACSEGSGPEHACDLLTKEEASELLGVPASGGYDDTDRSSGTYCEWRSEDSDDGHDASNAGGDGPAAYFISVEYERSLRAAQSFESSRAEGRDEVRGLGDAAYFSPRHGMQVRRGAQVFSTYAGGNEDHPLTNEESRAIERRAADIIIDRLGDSGDEAGLDRALECGRTGRCSGTRYRACDLLEEGEIEELTEERVERVDGASIPAGSDEAAVCTFYLLDPNPEEGELRDFNRVEVRVDPDPAQAEALYEEAFSLRGDDARDLPELGDDAFYSPRELEVHLLTDDAYLSVAYEAFDGWDDVEQEERQRVEDAAIELAAIALRRLR